MLFNTFQFGIFFGALLVLYWSAPKSARAGILLAGSFLFYALWIPAYLLLLLFMLTVNYTLLHSMARSRRPRLHLAASIIFTLSNLAIFKYAALLITSLLPVLSQVGWNPDIPDLFLPLGVSFYSFQIMALSIDTYRRRIEPVSSFGRYALFISFFPQLIAGPIVRGSEFLPQLDRGPRISAQRIRQGLWLLISGIVKKVIFADFLLSVFVNDVFLRPEVVTAPFLLVGVYSFAFQIYFDFSGYTDMARGLACLLGYDLPLNFREPYLSRNPAEFWQRWHITLSTWLRDYLFYALGGGGRGSARAALNLFVTMLLGGLWHGAAWTFAFWGAYHGLLLMLHRIAIPILRRIAPSRPLGRALWDGIRILVTFHLICLGLVFFRATSFENGQLVLEGLFTKSYLLGWPILQTWVVAICMGLHGAERLLRTRLPDLQRRMDQAWWGPFLEGPAYGVVLAIAIAVSGSGGEFIYFQF